VIYSFYLPLGRIYRNNVTLTKVQSRLADFFLSEVLANRQIIIEKHSEHIINRIRYRIAANDIKIISELARIHFVEKKEVRSTFRQVEIKKYGSIKDWAEGFFDQTICKLTHTREPKSAKAIPMDANLKRSEPSLEISPSPSHRWAKAASILQHSRRC